MFHRGFQVFSDVLKITSIAHRYSIDILRCVHDMLRCSMDVLRIFLLCSQDVLMCFLGLVGLVGLVWLVGLFNSTKYSLN